MKQTKPVPPVDPVVRVTLFGAVELSNRLGSTVENPSRQSLPWLLLKYLLANRGREVSLTELTGTIWPEEEGLGAARVRLRRLRDSLAPLGLDGKHGLILFSDGRYSLNPEYDLDVDADRFAALTARSKGLSADDPEGLKGCVDALELMRGRFMEYTDNDAWLAGYRDYYYREFCALVRETLKRMKTVGDDSALPLLCLRAAVIVPGEEAIHKEIISYLVEQRRELELVRHVARLTRADGTGAGWLSELSR